MTWLRFGLAGLWLLFAAVAPAHAAVMSPPACHHMSPPHSPAPHMPMHEDGVMACRFVPVLVLPQTAVSVPERATVRTVLSPPPAAPLRGITPIFDPDPPRTFEA